jgi:hypothetical protein
MIAGDGPNTIAPNAACSTYFSAMPSKRIRPSKYPRGGGQHLNPSLNEIAAFVTELEWWRWHKATSHATSAAPPSPTWTGNEPLNLEINHYGGRRPGHRAGRTYCVPAHMCPYGALSRISPLAGHQVGHPKHKWGAFFSGGRDPRGSSTVNASRQDELGFVALLDLLRDR